MVIGLSPGTSAQVTPPPLALGQYQSFAAVADLMLNERIERDPEYVAAGRLTKPEADQRRFIAAALAEIWGCVRDLRRIPKARFMAVTRQQLLDTLDSAINSAEVRLRRHPTDRGPQHLLAQLHAMKWWHAFYPQPPAPGPYVQAPSGRVYALQMLLNLRSDALQLSMLAEQAAEAGKAAA